MDHSGPPSQAPFFLLPAGSPTFWVTSHKSILPRLAFLYSKVDDPVIFGEDRTMTHPFLEFFLDLRNEDPQEPDGILMVFLFWMTDTFREDGLRDAPKTP